MSVVKPVPPAYTIVEFQQGTKAWHEWRSQGIGASDAPAIMGENPWKSPAQVLREKCGGRSFGPNAAMAKRLKEEYNAKRYHQPSDEILSSWDYTGAVNDMRFLAELGWRIAEAPETPKYYPGEQFARPRLQSAH